MSRGNRPTAFSKCEREWVFPKHNPKAIAKGKYIIWHIKYRSCWPDEWNKSKMTSYNKQTHRSVHFSNWRFAKASRLYLLLWCLSTRACTTCWWRWLTADRYNASVVYCYCWLTYRNIKEANNKCFNKKQCINKPSKTSIKQSKETDV